MKSITSFTFLPDGDLKERSNSSFMNRVGGQSGTAMLIVISCARTAPAPSTVPRASVAPFDVHLVIANKDDEARTGATELAAALDRRGLDVLFDERTASPGVKFKDAELLGVPWIVVVGRGWANGVVELRNRFTGENREIPVDEAAATIEAAVRS